MKKILLLWLIVTNTAFADVCPSIDTFEPTNPPAGWTLNVPPVIEGETYEFGEAIHSLNGSFYYKRVICKYQACPSAFCPAFSILSDKQYATPISKMPPWNAISHIGSTLTCRPDNHDPLVCNFD